LKKNGIFFSKKAMFSEETETVNYLVPRPLGGCVGNRQKKSQACAKMIVGAQQLIFFESVPIDSIKY
jgi:hypothetical protein